MAIGSKRKEVAPEAPVAEKKESKSIDVLWGVVRGLCKVVEKHTGVDMNEDGKLGHMRNQLVVCLFALACIVGLVHGTTVVQSYYNGDATFGTARFVSDDAGAITLTVDKVVAALTGAVVGDVTGDLTGSQPVVPSSTKAVTYQVLASDYGTTIYTIGAVTNVYTLPANGAAIGSWFEVAMGAGATDATIVTNIATTTDTLVGPGDQDLKSVTWGSGHRIGAKARFISDGAFWHVENLGGTTMTYND